MSLDATIGDTPERAELREVARDFLAKAAHSERVRAVVAAGGDPDGQLHDQAARMGWFGLEISEQHGGSDAQFADLVVLLEESGESLTSLPLLSSAVLCVGAILHGGSADQQARWLPDLAEGILTGTAVLPGAFGGTGTPIIATGSDAGYSLDGECTDVLGARTSDLLVVAAQQPTTSDGRPGQSVIGVIRRDAAGVVVAARPMLDATRPLDSVRLDGVVLEPADVLARGQDADRLLAGLANRAAVAIAADSLGVARRVLAMTVSYAGQREQFGRAIGSFQAVKHQAANVHVDNEVGSGLVAAAANTVDQDFAAAATTVQASMAKSYSCAAGTRGAGVAVQLHGGIGYTWEHDLHLYLKRAALNEQLFGSARWHNERIARDLLSEPPKRIR